MEGANFGLGITVIVLSAALLLSLGFNANTKYNAAVGFGEFLTPFGEILNSLPMMLIIGCFTLAGMFSDAGLALAGGIAVFNTMLAFPALSWVLNTIAGRSGLMKAMMPPLQKCRFAGFGEAWGTNTNWMYFSPYTSFITFLLMFLGYGYGYNYNLNPTGDRSKSTGIAFIVSAAVAVLFFGLRRIFFHGCENTGSMFLGVFVGMMAAGLWGLILERTAPSMLPFSGVAKTYFSNTDTKPVGNSVRSGGAGPTTSQCSANQNGDEFVCHAYRNGELLA